ncbi:hypothetical protein CKO42_22945 [Lamprobacter modestohalophilus]|uniref:Uncharacterized protein n=1 Tax=Lamprobacter modestohalophilus TaxID=1064514 RepID=A0A9X0WCU4_9GAMM|nr:hypothetical protein [Lamprobacter modestohalophilus]MBK1621220.1 hypothetical protein [Lamprobacter modestohalophilus]
MGEHALGAGLEEFAQVLKLAGATAPAVAAADDGSRGLCEHLGAKPLSDLPESAADIGIATTDLCLAAVEGVSPN